MVREKGKGKETTSSSFIKCFKVHKGLLSKPSPSRSGRRPGPNPFDDDPDRDHGDDEPEGDDDGPDGDGDHDDDDEDPEDPDDLRVQQPDKYNPAGKVPIAEWLFKMNLWFQAAQVKCQDKIIQAVLLLEGHALTWWMMIDRENKKPINWTRFEQQINEQFTSFNESLVARDKLYSLKQTSSVQEYVGIFNRTAYQIRDLAKSEAFYRFKKGLKPEIITKMDEMDIQYRDETDSLRILQDAALRFNTVTFYHKSRGYQFKTSHKAGFNRRDLNEIDSKDKKKITCFNCNKEGHMAKDCKKPKKSNKKKEFIDTRKVNSITINFKKAKPEAKMPQYRTEGAAGADLTPSQSGTIPKFSTKRIPTGLSVEIPKDHHGQIHSRSSLLMKRIVITGILDSDYRGNIDLIVTNNNPYEVEYSKNGEPMAQLIIIPNVRVKFSEVS